MMLTLPFATVARAEVDGGTSYDDGGIHADDGGAPLDGGLGKSDAGPSPAPEADGGAPPADAGVKPGFTGVVGRVTDAKSGEALIEANVKVVKGPVTKTALTDLDGNYKLKLPPGEYEIRCWYDVYKPKRLGNVLVEKGKATRLDIQLGADDKAVMTVVVEAKLEKRSSEALLQDRKRAVAAQDAISAQEIARSPDTSASDAIKRVPSATVVDNRYVFIRGLGGRYSSILLNRTELPSPEPDEPSIPLDMFPTALLSNLNIIKTYSADLPGNFSGGALVIETHSYPSKLELKLKASIGYNSEATFRSMNTYPGGAADWLGFDDGTRALPASVPVNAPATSEVLDQSGLERIGESFKNIWSPRKRLGIPDIGIAASIGGTRHFKGNDKLGWLAAVNYGYKDRVRVGQIVVGRLTSDGGVEPGELSNFRTGIQSAQLGALLNLGLSLKGAHEINLFAFYTHNTDNEAYTVSGFNSDAQQDFEASRLRFVERGLFYMQLKGDHRFQKAHNLELSWQGNFSSTQRDEPDTRDVAYNIVSLDPRVLRFRDEPQSGEHFFSKLREQAGGGSLHITVPWEKFRLRFGAFGQSQARRFDARRFRFERQDNIDFSVLNLPPEELFSPAHVGTDVQIAEKTQNADSYDGALTVGGGYVAGELNAPEKLRIIAGVRYEVARQTLSPGSPTSITKTTEKGVDRLDSDFMPSFNMVYALRKDMNFRAAYAYTLARPRLRELAPFFYYDFQRRRPITGNPDLATTHIHNADLRWEWFPSENGVLAASVFYKYFDSPIEQVIFSVVDAGLSYKNASAAHLVGGELEARNNFGFLHKRLRNFFGAFNMALIWSQVSLGADAGASAGRSRPLQGQSPWVFNLTLGYSNPKSGTDVSILYNVYGPRIIEVGFQPGGGGAGLPDIYEQPWHRLDVSASQRLHKQVRLKLTATNLAYQPIRIQQASITNYSYQPGVTISASLEWNPY